MTKGKTIHIRITDEQFKRLAITAIDQGISRNLFVERAIEHYCNFLDEFTFEKK